MPVVIPPGFGEASFIFTGDVGTAPYVTTLGVSLADAGGDFVAAANGLMQSYNQAFGGSTSESLSLDRVILAVGQDGAGGSVESTVGPYQGQGTGDFAPTAMSTIMRKETAVLGRKGRGRMFMPGSVFENNVNEAGALPPGAIADFSSRGDDFFTALTSGVPAGVGVPTPPVLLHSSALLPTPITGFSPARLVGWIRGRVR